MPAVLPPPAWNGCISLTQRTPVASRPGDAEKGFSDLIDGPASPAAPGRPHDRVEYRDCCKYLLFGKGWMMELSCVACNLLQSACRVLTLPLPYPLSIVRYSPSLTLFKVFGSPCGRRSFFPAFLSPAADDGVDADSTDLEGDGQRFNPAKLLFWPGMDAVVAVKVSLSMALESVSWAGAAD